MANKKSQAAEPFNFPCSQAKSPGKNVGFATLKPTNKKSQAAMEFLMTYGWALLMIVTAISALAYFGALNPKDWFSYNYCHIDGGLSCIDHSVEYIPPLPEMHGAVGKNDLVLNVKNNIGWNIEIENSVSRFR